MTHAVPAFRACRVRIDAVDRAEAAGFIVASAADGEPMAVHLCNAYTLSLTSRDPGLAALVDAGDLNLMDGMPLVWIARRLGVADVRRRVYGPDLMVDVLAAGVDAGLTHYLLGGSSEVSDLLPAALTRRVPGARIVGRSAPALADASLRVELASVADEISASGAHVVWVGLGTPKQDRAVQFLRERLSIPVVAVGAAFDFHAGAKRQAPRWMQDRGFEWLYRLATEPRRLWRRYLIGIPVFLLGVARGVEVVRTADGGTAAERDQGERTWS